MHGRGDGLRVLRNIVNPDRPEVAEAHARRRAKAIAHVHYDDRYLAVAFQQAITENA